MSTISRNNAIMVSALSHEGHWVCVGYLSREHASVAREILRHTEASRYRLFAVPDFDQEYETSIALEFIDLESSKTVSLIDQVFDVCGKARENASVVHVSTD